MTEQELGGTKPTAKQEAALRRHLQHQARQRKRASGLVSTRWRPLRRAVVFVLLISATFLVWQALKKPAGLADYSLGPFVAFFVYVVPVSVVALVWGLVAALRREDR